jgi:hypothetical protein
LLVAPVNCGAREDPYRFCDARRALKFRNLALQMTLDRGGQVGNDGAYEMNRAESRNQRLIKRLIEINRRASIE